jgi:predicted ATPase
MMSDYKVGKYGQNYIDQILHWRDTKAPEFKELVRILRELKLLYWLSIRKFAGGRFEPRVAVRSGGSWASLMDSGFGISQFLPIIVADLQLGKNSTLLVAQPEIHLHPSAQASLADYFIKGASEKGKNYIIETHSEYILNRFRAAVTKRSIQQKDLAVYYFENDGRRSTKYDVEFTKKGQIKNAPKGFFDTYMLDVMDIALSS